MSKKSNKSNLTVTMNESERDLLNFAVSIIHNDRFSYASLIVELIRRNIRDYLSFPDNLSLTDDQLLDLAIEKNERDVIAIIGQEKYDEFWKQKEGDKNE